MLVGGVGVVYGNSFDRYLYDAQFSHFGSDSRSLSGTMPSATGGADLALKVTLHLAVVPQFRVMVIQRGDPYRGGSAFSNFGLPTYPYRVGIGVRAAF
jgi:hypothetical protein